ncbi:hypothetical protein [Methylobacter sp.]|uniref:hypothetical protein n=1 Tax=Methylobacter sp. TaxID=2051955 RepID=UPI00121F7519|nr:hypothetical protein [Methylobacter sp.]TAK61294.1 MAG: hypothetical protein EPO18_14185 [Methylobacter sp.]
MNAKSNKIVKPDESQNVNQTVDKSRRSFAKVGAVAPVIMTLTSKSALGSAYHCTISGTQSGNHSSPHDNTTNCGVGFSPGGWWQNASKSGNQDGNINQWCKAGINPFSIKYAAIPPSSSKVKQIQVQGTWITATAANNWLSIFTAIKSKFGQPATATAFAPIFGGNLQGSLWDVLDQHQGTLEWHAVADYLNALLYAADPVNYAGFGVVYSGVSAFDIVNLYKLATGQISSFTSQDGVLINGTFNGGTNGSGVKSYLESLHH